MFVKYAFMKVFIKNEVSKYKCAPGPGETSPKCTFEYLTDVAKKLCHGLDLCLN